MPAHGGSEPRHCDLCTKRSATCARATQAHTCTHAHAHAQHTHRLPCRRAQQAAAFDEALWSEPPYRRTRVQTGQRGGVSTCTWRFPGDARQAPRRPHMCIRATHREHTRTRTHAYTAQQPYEFCRHPPLPHTAGQPFRVLGRSKEAEGGVAACEGNPATHHHHADTAGNTHTHTPRATRVLQAQAHPRGSTAARSTPAQQGGRATGGGGACPSQDPTLLLLLPHNAPGRSRGRP